MTGPYDDIITLPHHVSNRRPHMPVIDRAAQFAPFAALTGYDAAIWETARYTDSRTAQDESVQEMIGTKLAYLAARIGECPQATVTYFRPDERKEGGAYVTAACAVQKIDADHRFVLMADGTRIPMDAITEIESPLFGMMPI